MKNKLLPFLLFLFPALALAAGTATEKLDLTAAGIIWLLIAWVYKDTELANLPEHAVKHYLTEFAELFMFLLAAMTYVNAMSERNIFEALRGWLLNRGWSYRKLFWMTGILSFFLSPLIDNLTTALVIPEPLKARVELKEGAMVIIGLFIVTIFLAVTFHNYFHLPPFLGMVTGMALLKIFGYFLKQKEYRLLHRAQKAGTMGDITPFDSFKFVARAEWDTLLFFFGVVMCVGALGFIGYLHLLSQYMYGELGPITANVLVGILSAIVDNIPVMVAVLEMKPEMALPLATPSASGSTC